MACRDEVPDSTITDLPPSTQCIFNVLLTADDSLTTAELADETDYCPRTMRYAVNILGERGLVNQHFDSSDPRIRRYSIKKSGLPQAQSE